MATATAKQLVRWLDELGRISDERGRLTRTFLSPAMRRANDRVAGWMRAAGLTVREDAVGNLIGRLESAQPKAKTLLLGSHLDTVRDAGRFDGALGVLLPIAALAELRRRKVKLPFAVEVLGFSEEEGVRFSSAYLGSKGYTGQLGAGDLKLRDVDGITVREAMQRWSRQRRPEPVHPRADLLGYLEVHIEQGPVLEAKNLAVGAVSAIAGQTRLRVTITGKAGHAGTTPMHLRRDALAVAGHFISCVEVLAQRHPPLVATVGTIQVSPGASNVIAGQAVLSVDVRHPQDDVRNWALQTIMQMVFAIIRDRKVQVRVETTQENRAVACSPELSRALERSVKTVQGKSVSLVSGAGHDAVVMSALTPVAMLFVRCREGLSHHPDEYASPRDIGVALNVVVDFLQQAGRASARPSVGKTTGERAG